MNDLIDRQAVLDIFKPWLDVKGYSEGELNMLRAVIYELETMPSTSAWVSVKDRLPEPFEDVLTYDDKCKIIINWFEEIEDGISYFAYSGKNVTHWMPLPSIEGLNNDT